MRFPELLTAFWMKLTSEIHNYKMNFILAADQVGGVVGSDDIKLSMGDKFSVCESFGCGGGRTRRAIIADIFVNQPGLLNTFQ